MVERDQSAVVVQLDDVVDAKLVGAVNDDGSNDKDDDDDDAKNQILLLQVKMRAVQSDSALDTKSAPASDDFRPSEDEVVLQQVTPYSKDEEFDVFEYITLKCQRSVLIQSWDFLLGTAALLDFLGAMANRHGNFSTTSSIEYPPTSLPTMRAWHLVCWSWLGHHSNGWSIWFSLLWAVDAFVEAHRRRLQDVRERDRKRLLHQDDGSSVSSSETKLDQVDDWWRGSLGVYYRTIFFQLLTLPVGFYVVLSHLIRKLYDPVMIDGDHDVVVVPQVKASDNFTMLLDGTHPFCSQASVSLITALARYLIITVGRFTGQYVRLRAVTRMRRVGILAFRRVIRHPIRFYRRASKLLRVARWIKYLGPLFGEFNKLLGSLKELRDKHKQRGDAKRASAAMLKLWRQWSDEVLREYCATLIQKNFRAHQSRRCMHALQLMRREEEVMAAMRLQSAFRASLRRARARLKQKMLELQKLKEQGGGDLVVAPTKEMSAQQRRRMYQLQEELEAETRRLLNEKLLLRPNTSFAVTWKILFVVAVLFEILILVCQPVLARHKDPVTRKPLDVESFLDRILVPMRVSTLSACKTEKPFGISFKRPVKSARKILERVMRNEETKSTSPKPYYCSKVFAFLQSIYIFVLRIFIHDFLVCTSVVCFLDVFVTFFTGQLSPDTGALEPKRFFERWIMPGLVLQLLVNPKMEYVSSLVGRGLNELLHHSIVRVFRWTIALFYPICQWVVFTTRRVWIKYTAEQNRSHTIK